MDEREAVALDKFDVTLDEKRIALTTYPVVFC